MKKNLAAFFTAAAMCVSAVPFVSAQTEDVEISFKVGDSVLLINGVETEVETPYVAGEGTTLVPLRVITEAFGTQVEWEGSSQTITLTYPGVNIVLQIGNIVAQVNDHSETLLESPVLSENGVTMVPLRFISETFGADVGYNAETGAILVTKKKSDNSQTVVGATDLKRTGDSYYSWSIDTPTQMTMTDRRLDGLDTTFTADDESSFNISIFTIDEDTPAFDEEFSKAKDAFSSYTLINAEKLTDSSGVPYIHIQAKNKEIFVDFREYYTEKYMYDVVVEAKANDDTSIKDMMLAASDSFKLGASDTDTYDLSTVSDGSSGKLRNIISETYGVNFKVPADYQISTTNDVENEFHFYDPAKDSNAYVSLGIYSKTPELTAKSLAERDRNSRFKNSNPKFVQVSEVTSTGDSQYRYTQTISGTKKRDCYAVDTFFESGDYIYNFTVTQNGKGSEMLINEILKSLRTEVLDSSKIGKLMRNDSDETPMSVKIDDYQFTLPASWKSIASADQNTINIHDITASAISAHILTKNSGSNDTSLAAKTLKGSLLNETGSKLVKDISYESINDKRYAYFTVKKENNDITAYSTVYVRCENSKILIFTLLQEEIFYDSAEIDTLRDAIAGFTER